MKMGNLTAKKMEHEVSKSLWSNILIKYKR